jgi:uncharacterized protein
MSIETPCKKICVLDLKRELCEGCGRTRAEIAGWLNMTAAERRTIMNDLPARLRKTASGTPRGQP